MNDELLLRIGVVLGATLVAVAVAIVLRQGRSMRRYRIRIDGLGPGVYLFTSAACATCARMRDRIAGRPDVTEIAYETGEFPSQVRRVPAVACLDPAGEGWIAYGEIRSARLDRWIADGP